MVLPLLNKLLGITPQRLEELPDELQVTIERKPDLLKRVMTHQGEELILHIEFQAKNDRLMPYRMLEYKALLLRKYRLPVHQLVLYLGDRPLSMADHLTGVGLSFRYTLQNIKEYDYHVLLASPIPEEVVLAILGNFNREKADQAIRKILERLQAVADDPPKLQRYIRQLTILANLRNLREEIYQQIKTMPITYDITKDFLYQEGEQIGEQKEKKETIVRMLRSGQLTVAQIAQFADVSEAFVNQVAQELT